MSNIEISVRTIEEYSDDVACRLGELVCFLTPSATGEPIHESRLRAIIDSDSHDQLVAEVEGRIMGAATLSVVRGLLGTKAYLEDFVTDAEIRGQGAGDAMWQKMIEWCKGRNLDGMAFTSSYSREEAHRFYLSHGAEIRTTSAPFWVDLNKE